MRESRNKENNKVIFIWDSDDIPPVFSDTVILWNGFQSDIDKKIISLPKFLEENADKLKKRYLAWIYDVGVRLIDNKKIVDHLEIRPGLSYWWMLPLTEKSVFKSPQLTSAIKLFAIEELLNGISPNKIILVSRDDKIASVICKWCKTQNISFEKTLISRNIPLKLSRIIPVSVYAFFFLMRLFFIRFSLIQKNNVTQPKAKISFIDYFANFQFGKFESKKFSSNYWKKLINTLYELKIRTNWLHLFPSDTLGASKAVNLANKFTKQSENLECHSIINSSLSISMLLGILIDFFSLCLKRYKLKKISNYFKPINSELDLWPLYLDEWDRSLCGITAISNCLMIRWIEISIRNLPKQNLGFYLQENHAWEIALNYYWRKFGNGELFGVAHSTVRFWDLRYFHDKRTYNDSGHNPLPRPNMIAINGEVSKQAFEKWDYPAKELVEVEAVRYQYLLSKPDTPEISDPTFFKILVCGDIMQEATRSMMKLIERASVNLPAGIIIEVKPHPLCMIKQVDYPKMNFNIVEKPLEEILIRYNVVFTSNSTSAAVDAYCFGLPVIQIIDGNSLNMSPLRNIEGVIYITDDITLVNAINEVSIEKHFVFKPFFYLNKDLPKWKKLLTNIKC
jgi:surface carbohydrate biosynthesis protein (TIGR04326 family)